MEEVESFFQEIRTEKAEDETKGSEDGGVQLPVSLPMIKASIVISSGAANGHGCLIESSSV